MIFLSIMKQEVPSGLVAELITTSGNEWTNKEVGTDLLRPDPPLFFLFIFSSQNGTRPLMARDGPISFSGLKVNYPLSTVQNERSFLIELHLIKFI
jgi:hypothetical protein